MNAKAKSNKIAQVPDKSDMTCTNSIRTLLCYFTAVLLNLIYQCFIYNLSFALAKLDIRHTPTFMTIKAKLGKRFYN